MLKRLLLLILILVLVSPAQARAETADGVFITACNFSHRLSDDPIVFPGQPGASHSHDFIGNPTTNANSTYESMTAVTEPKCPFKPQTSGYWTATLLDANGNAVAIVDVRIYYRNRPWAYRMTQPFPADFRQVFGGAGLSTSVVSWNCSTHDDSVKLATIPDCPAGVGVRSNLKSPNCWNGWQLDSPDHRSHLVYPKSLSQGDATSCPPSHPVKVPQLSVHVKYAPVANEAALVFSDGTTKPHFDFWNTWQQAELEAQVVRCLNAGINCGVLKS